MVDREYKRNDKGRFVSAEEMQAAELEKMDAAMSKWIIQRVNNSGRARLARMIFGNPQEDKQ